MKIQVQDPDHKYNLSEVKEAEYEDTTGDWDFFFESLRAYRDYLRLRTKCEDSLGRELALSAKADRMDTLFKKYEKFVIMAEAGRYSM